MENSPNITTKLSRNNLEAAGMKINRITITRILHRCGLWAYWPYKTLSKGYSFESSSRICILTLISLSHKIKFIWRYQSESLQQDIGEGVSCFVGVL